MRRTMTVLTVATMIAAPANQALAKGHSSPDGVVKSVKMGDGLYTIADRSVACRVRGDHLTCANRFDTVVCRGVVCETGEAEDYPRDIWVEAKDAKRPEARVWKPGLVVDAASTACWVKRSYIECVVEDPQGGFQMSGLFSRVVTWNSAPSRTWPWDGKTYTLKDMPCVHVNCQVAQPHSARSRPSGAR